MPATIEDLRVVPLFRGMTDRALEAVAALADEVEFPGGTAVTTEGEDGDAFYMLLAGVVRVSRAGTLVGELASGAFIGEISLIDGRPRTATVVAVGPVRTLVVRRDAFLELMDRFPAVRLGVMMALADRIRSDERAPID
ncbi:MAG TPA: cyclic nucleotide-binding domain-containing protein [Candidatus Limnocylindrales bacterium]|nr:cyclic nucleotide-binding domain-containing protein [Candidatus Limnocylindrales bacterium]